MNSIKHRLADISLFKSQPVPAFPSILSKWTFIFTF